MNFATETEGLEALKKFIAVCTVTPEVLNTSKLSFFKEFIEKLGGKVPAGECKMPSFESSEKSSSQASPPSPESEDNGDESEKESDIELDMEGVIEADMDDPQEMGDPEKEPTEEEMDQASDIRSEAASAYSEQKFEEAIDLYTKAIKLNPGNALFHAKRGQTYLKLKKPKACIRDCIRALELNCDSAAAYKFRGRANRLLGNWEEAAKDLRQACKLDYDEEADEWLKEVTPNAKKIEQHKIKWDRIKTEKEIKKRQERVRKAQEANKKAQAEEELRSQSNPTPRFPGGMPGMPGMPGGMPGMPGGMPGMPGGMPGGAPNLGNLFGDMDENEILTNMNDPEVAAALKDIKENPANISKYLSNPKFLNLAYKLGNAARAGGADGGMPGGMPGFGGGMPSWEGEETPPSQPKPSTKKPDFSDDGLD